MCGRVVIAIDELDKLAQPTKVRALLRDIKGIFEIPGVFFLVSVSDEAARSLSIGALTGRDEFNSSFYTVIEVPPVTPDQLAQLLLERGGQRMTREVAIALGVLAGGNPREVVRLTELVPAGADVGDAITMALRGEALRLRREIVTAPQRRGRIAITEEERAGAFEALPDSCFDDARALRELTSIALGDLWHPEWEDEGVAERFGTAWRRLMIRFAVAEKLLASDSLIDDPDLALRMRDVIVAAAQSAEIARVILERGLRVEADRPSALRREARDALVEIASQYDGRFDDERTDRLFSDARQHARRARLTSAELIGLLHSAGPGNRLVGLAVAEATGDPAAYDALLSTVQVSRNDREYRYAQAALDVIRPKLSDRQRQRIDAALGTESQTES
jgi:hypothetical protein